MGKQVDEFVTEDGDAAGLEADDGDSGFDFGREFVEDLKQERLGAVEHAVVVERASAAEIGLGDDDSEACGFQDFDGGFGGGGMEIVVESVGPEEDRRASSGLIPCLSLPSAALKRAPLKAISVSDVR